ncbi:hypothetical protein CJ197_10475 [Brachybacterium sp. UMB0905]|nr:hypothetical protein CJ197_10475 [Brachybacterium sp. UMB0905]
MQAARAARSRARWRGSRRAGSRPHLPATATRADGGWVPPQRGGRVASRRCAGSQAGRAGCS